MSGPASILVVDDNTDIATSVADILKNCGHRVDTANNGTDAIELVRDRSYDVVILDYQMPDMDGAEVYRQIRQIQSVTVAVMVTAFAGDNGVQDAIDAGTWRVLRKPMDVGELLNLIEVALNQKTVLLIDDDEEFCASIWGSLRHRGFRVGLAHDVTSAEHELNSREYDVVLLDLHLGDIVSDELLDHLGQSKGDPRVFIVNGLDKNDEAMKRVSNRRTNHIHYKPLAIDEVIDSLS
ncbi:response regulator transcription factor [Planctomycetota bacterium]